MAKKNPNPIDMHVGTRVRSRRQELGLSQEKLGDALKLTFQQVQKYEKGVNRVSASRLQQLSHILKVPVAYFFEGTPGKFKSQGNAPSLEYVSEFTATVRRSFTREGICANQECHCTTSNREAR